MLSRIIHDLRIIPMTGSRQVGSDGKEWHSECVISVLSFSDTIGMRPDFAKKRSLLDFS